MSTPEDLLLSEREHRRRQDQVWKALLVVLAVFRLPDVVTGQRELPWVLVDIVVIALAGYFVVSGLVRRTASFLRWFTEPVETCPACRHDWREHDVDGSPCGECEYEVEHEDPDAPASPCRARPPTGTSTLPQR